MLCDRKSCLILVQLCIVIVCRADTDYFASSTIWSDKEYVDPHSFYYDKATQKESLTHKEINDPTRDAEYSSNNALSCKVELNRCKSLSISAKKSDISDEMFSRRLISMLLDRASFKNEDSIFIGHIELEATESQLNLLREFSAGKSSLREIDPVLNNVLKAPDVNRIYETVIQMTIFTTELSNYMCYHKEIIIGVITALYLYWKFRKVNWTFWKIISLSIPVILIVSFFITWWKLIEDARIQHIVLQVKNTQMPNQCQPEKMNWMDKMRAWFYSDDCEKYYEAVMKTPDLQVTPIQALTHMVAHMLYEPIILGGKAISEFLKNVTSGLPWPLNLGVQSIGCIGVVPAIIFCAIMLAGGSLSLGFGPMSLFSMRGPGRSDRRQNLSHESTIDRRPIENIPNVTVNVHIQDSGGGGRFEITNLDRLHNMAITGSTIPQRSDQSKALALQANFEPAETSQSNCLPITQNSETCNEHKSNEQGDDCQDKDGSSGKARTSRDPASGDSISTNSKNATEKPVETRTTDAVREPELRSGGGDN